MTAKHMTRPVIVAIVLAGLGVSSASAFRDPPVLGDSGLFYAVQADVSPPRASTEQRRQGARVDFTAFTGNIRTGEPASGGSAMRSLEIRSPRGFKYNHKGFPSCRIARLAGGKGCPRGSRIGSGTAIADPRPLLPDFIRVRQVRLFNGRLTNGGPALLLDIKVFGELMLALPFEIKRARGKFGPSFVFDAGPQPPAGQGALSAGLVSVHVTFSEKARRLRGRRLHLWETSSTCEGSWLVQAAVTTYAGQRLVANDRVPCVK